VQFFDVLTADLDFAFVLAGLRKIVTRLHAYPRLRRAAKRLRKPDSHFSANAGSSANDFRKRLPADAKNLCARGLGQAQRLKAIMADDAAGMGGVFHGHGVLAFCLVVVDQLNVKDVRSFKTENDAPVRPHGAATTA
jgi:hypothetical protein